MALGDLLAEIDNQGEQPLVSLELFFTDNDDPASIGCNLLDHPGIATFAKVLHAIRERPGVADVVVRITEVMPDGEWPFSDQVCVLTEATPDEVASWAADLQPDQPAVAQIHGRQAVVLWWD